MAQPTLREGLEQDMRELPVALKEIGHDPGPVDDQFGPQDDPVGGDASLLLEGPPRLMPTHI
jgi:hypothetical protein